MPGGIEKIEIGGRFCTVCLPVGYGGQGRRYPVLYLSGAGRLDEILAGLDAEFSGELPFLLVNVEPLSWSDDYTPWPAPALRGSEKPFGGRAGECLHELIDHVKPFIDTHFATDPSPGQTALMGYSLAGLFSLYALYHCGAFGRVASLSGSLWYEGWVEEMRTHEPVNKEARVYLSLGSAESRSRNERMARVGDCTQAAADILRGQLENTANLKFEWNSGGHFSNIPQRFVRAVRWLMAD